MKVFSLINFFILSNLVQCKKFCEKPILRREIRDLSRLELKNLTDAMAGLMKNSEYSDKWYELVKVHYEKQYIAHGVPLFLPWHRYHLRLYEKLLQLINPSVSLPYWNWSLDSQAPETSIVFTDAYFGGNGGLDNCIDSGPFAWTYSNITQYHCIKRDFDGGTKLSSFYSPETLEVLLATSSNYDEFRVRISGPPHGRVHESVGGELGDLFQAYSPNDPIFWIHHCFIDMLWWNWQKRMGPMGLNYGGTPNATYFQKLDPWPIDVYSVLNTTNNAELCYEYPEFKVKLPKIMPNINPENLISPSMRSKKTNSQKKLLSNLKKKKFEKLKIKGLDLVMEQIANGEVETEKVGSLDRTKKNKIRSPTNLKPETIEMLRLDPVKVKEDEDFFELVAEAFNSVEDYDVNADLK